MKAEHILSASKDIIEKFDGEVPNTVEDLMSLAGVGKKTANVVYSVAFGGAAIAVDTHVFRVSNRLGLAKGATPEKVEEGLCKAIPKADWAKAHHWLIYHGRRVCHSQRPSCAACTLAHLCDFYKKK
jgi:endonuclease-3